MVRDFSRFLPPSAVAGTRPTAPTFLERLGWSAHFARQIGADEFARTPPVRVIAIERSGAHILGEGLDDALPPRSDITVGDWLLYDSNRPSQSRLLDRLSLFKRRAPGTDRQIQLISANVDTVFIVSSLNQDFNVARLERYAALAFEAGAAAAIVLTKRDLCPEPDAYLAAATAISDAVPVVAIDALAASVKGQLAGWLTTGRTIACLGSSGVGKSTLVNTLLGRTVAATAGIREDDDKGRHTTTGRQLHVLPDGGLIIDTPGMRELQLADAADGIAEVFADLQDLARQCRFSDCRHDGEPGCAVGTAIEAGMLDPIRLERWRKLVREDAFNSASLAERRAKDRSFGKMTRSILREHAKYRK